MPGYLRLPLAPPNAPDDDQNQRSRLLHALTWGTIGFAILPLLLIVLLQPDVRGLALSSLAYVVVLGLAVLELNRRGRRVPASWLFVVGLIARVTWNALEVGGIHSPGVGSFLVFTLIAGLLLGQDAGIATAIGCALIGLALVIAETTGWLSPSSAVYSPATLWMLHTMYLGIALVLLHLSTRTLTSVADARERALKERERTEGRLTQALDAAAMGVWEQNLKTGVFRGDDRARALFGLDAVATDAMTFDAWRRLVHPADVPRLMAAWQALSAGGAAERTEFRIVRRDGSRRHLELVAKALPDDLGAPAYTVGMITDVTARSEVTRDRERLVYALGERVKELRLLHGAAGLLQSDRPFTRAVLEHLAGMMPHAWRYPNACQARIVYRDIEVTTAGWCESPWTHQVTFTTTGGNGVIEVVYSSEQPWGQEGPFLAEERALLESLAEMLSAYLERDAAEQRRMGLETQLRQAQKMDALGTLAGGIAHDFNNILTAILANVDLCQLELPPHHPAQSMLNEVAKASTRAADLVKRVLTFSRRQETSKKLIAIETVVQDAVQLLRASLPKSIDIRLTCAADTPRLLADATQIHQIVMNLGTNAGYAMAAAGGTMTVSLDRMTLREGMETPSVQLNPGSYARLSVRDTGTGMSTSTLDRLFDPFFTTKGVDGTGLGLSVVHGIVRDHAGAVVVKSALGEGSRFDIWLPAAEGVTEVHAGAAAAGVRTGRGGHILYVDDEEALVVVMTRTLERLGYRCTGFTDPERALQAFRTTPRAFDAGLVDLAMPTMSGLELVRALRAIRADLPIAVTTGYAVEDPGALERAGVVARLPKPVTRENLGRTLETLLSAPV